MLSVRRGIASGAPVKRTVRQHRDVTDDGRLDDIFLRVTSADQPYTWTLRIRAEISLTFSPKEASREFREQWSRQ